jgi:hypothetical protein
MNSSPQQRHIENITSTDKTQIRLDLFQLSFRNEQFEENLAYFKKAQPAIYNAVVNHCCKEYRLCSNPDGSPNIIETKSNTPVYNTFDKNPSGIFSKKASPILQLMFQYHKLLLVLAMLAGNLITQFNMACIPVYMRTVYLINWESETTT